MSDIGRNLEIKKQIIRIVSIALFMLAVFLYGFSKLIKINYLCFSQPKISIIFLAFSFLAVTFTIVLYVFTLMKEIKIEHVFIFSMIVLTLLYMFFFLPVSVPDEQTHFASVYRMSNYFLLNFQQVGSQGVYMRKVDVDFLGIMNTKLSEQNYRAVIQNASWYSNDNTMMEYHAKAVMTAPVGYVASAVGIAIGRLINLGAVPLFYLGRLFNSAAFILLVYFAMKKMPFGKIFILVVCMLPMTLHLCASYSYDCIILGLAMLFVAEILSIIYGKNTTRSQIIICCILAFLLAPSKLVYFPIVFMALLIPADTLRRLYKRPWLLKMSIIISGFVGFLIFQASAIFNGGNTCNTVVWSDKYISWANEKGFSVSWVLHNPIHTLTMIANTFITRSDFYFMSAFGGSLGWFQIPLPMYLYLPFALLLILSFFRRRDEKCVFRFSERCWILVLSFCTVILIIMSMFLTWTPQSCSSVEGVQGRYFLPIFPLLFLVFRNNMVVAEKRLDRHIMFCIGPLNIFVLAYAFLYVFHVL